MASAATGTSALPARVILARNTHCNMARTKAGRMNVSFTRSQQSSHPLCTTARRKEITNLLAARLDEDMAGTFKNLGGIYEKELAFRRHSRLEMGHKKARERSSHTLPPRDSLFLRHVRGPISASSGERRSETRR